MYAALIEALLIALQEPLPTETDRASTPQESAVRELTERFEAPPGTTVLLYAQSPLCHNPAAIDVDLRGRVWVAEAVNYRKWRGRNPGLRFEGGDRIVILDDTNQDGVADTSKVFAQDQALVAPLGLAVFGSRVVVSCSPTAWVFTDEDGDDVADKKEALLTGFGGFDHDHGLHSFVGGPDGLWWFNVGNAGPHLVTDKGGWSLRSGSVYVDGGPELADNKPSLSSDDGRVWTGGLVLSTRQDGSGLRVRAHNFRNNYEVALDSFGNQFQTDNDDGPPVSRTLWCMEGGNHGFFSEDGSRFWSADQRPGQSVAAAHWHSDDPGVVPAGCVHGAGGPTGLCVYEGPLLRAYDGCVLDADAGRNVVYAHRPIAVGAGYALEHGVFLQAKFGAGFDEESHQFRPSDVAAGIDGSIYVADWFDPGVGGHAMADVNGYGRILRVASTSSRLVNPRMGLASVEASLSALLSPAVNVRWQAFEGLRARGAEIVPRLKLLLIAPNPRHVARALWLLATLGDQGRAAVRETLSHANPELRLTALRALCANGVDALELAKFAVDDPDPRLPAELALQLRDVPWERSGELLVRLAAKPWIATDAYYLEALGQAAQGKERELWRALAIAFDPAQPVADHSFWLAWRLRVEEALPLLRHVAFAEGFKPAVDAIGFLSSRAAAEAMLDIALAGKAEVRDYAAWWVRFRGTNTWRAFDLARELGDFDRARGERVWSSGALSQSELRQVEIPLQGQTSLMLVVTGCDDGIGYDWAAWIAPRFEVGGKTVALGTLPWVRASAGFGSVHVGQNCEGGPLVVDGVTHADGIGTHAESEIVYRIPKGATKFSTQYSPDDYGSDRAGSVTKLEFEIWLSDDSARTAAPSPRARLEGASSAAERARIALELASSSDGALALLHLARTQRLTADVRDAVASALRTHADPAIRALAAQDAAPAPGASKLAPETVLALAGDRKRGARAFFGEQAACSRCHSVRGRGSDVGPDLSDIRRKYARGELLDQVLNPSKAIEFGYQTWIVETKDGRIFSGFLQAGSPRTPGDGVVVLKSTDGHRQVIDEREIEAAHRQETSVMPDDAAMALTAQDVADVLAFLHHDPATPPVLDAPITLFNGRDLAGWKHFSSDSALAAGDVWSVRAGVLRCKGRPAGYLFTERQFESFVLELDWRWDPAEAPSNSGVLLRQHGPEQIWPRAIEAQLMHKHAGDIWNIGEFPMVVDPGRTDGRHTAKLQPASERPIGEWNHYKITLREGELTLEVNGVVQNTARWCAEIPGAIALQSEGSAIEFRDIVLTPIQ